jgi:uncharacterized protein (TIGR02246 family)
MKTTTQDEQAVRKLHDNVLSALNELNTEKLLSLHTDNVVLMEPNMPAIIGKKQMAELFEKFKKQKVIFSLSFTIEEIEIFGDRALVRGQIIRTTFKNHWNRVEELLKFMTFSKKQTEGSWLRTHVMVNSEMPLEEKPAAPRFNITMGFRDKLWKN